MKVANITKGNQKLNNCKGDKNIYGSLVSNINNYNRDGRRFDYKYPYYSPFCKIDNSKQWTLISGIDTDWNGSTSGNKVSEEKFYNTQNNTEYMKNNIDNTNIQNFKSFLFKDNNLSSIPSDSDSNMLMNANSQDTITTKQNYYINFRSEMLNPNEKAGPRDSLQLSDIKTYRMINDDNKYYDKEQDRSYVVDMRDFKTSPYADVSNDNGELTSIRTNEPRLNYEILTNDIY